MLLLIRPKSQIADNFFQYLCALLAQQNIAYKAVGEYVATSTSPSLAQSMWLAVRLLANASRLRSLFCSRQPRFYLFADALTLPDALLSKLLGRQIFVYIHEPVITKTRPSSYLKQWSLNWVMKLAVCVGPGMQHPLKLLFQAQPQFPAPSQATILCFGTWIQGKVGSHLRADLQLLNSKGFYLLRAGRTDNKELLALFDEVHDRFIDEAEKTELFGRSSALYLPYTPTAQSGVLADCLSFGLTPIVHNREPFRGTDFETLVQEPAELDLVNAGKQASAVRGIWQQTHQHNCNLISHMLGKHD